MKRPKLKMPTAAIVLFTWLKRNTIKITLGIALLALLFAPIPATWVIGAIVGILLAIAFVGAYIGAIVGAFIGFLDWGSRVFIAYGNEIGTAKAWLKRIMSRKAAADTSTTE